MGAPKTSEDTPSRDANIWAVVVWSWLVVGLLTLYHAPSVREEIAKKEALSESWLMPAATQLMKASDVLGFTALREALDGARAAINAPYTILEPAAPAAPVAVTPDAGTPEDAGVGDQGRLVHVSAPAKQRVLVVGASSIQFAIGTELEQRLPRYAGVKVRRYGKLATGLSRPDYFDWPKKITSLASTFKPDLIIANFGGNGAQAIPLGKYKEARFKTPEWDAEYARRVTEVVRIGDRFGADVVFLGMPNMRKAKFAAKMKYLNAIQKAAAEAAGAIWIDTWPMSSTAAGKYRKSVKVGKKRGLMRTSDGVHYTRLGAKFIIDRVMQQLERTFTLEPPDERLATSQPHAVKSLLLDQTMRYTAYVPRGAEGQPLRWLLVLPGAGDDAPRWPDAAHRRLQTLAQRHRLVLVVPDMSSFVWYVDGSDVNQAFARHLHEELLRDVTDNLPVQGAPGLVGRGSGGHAAMFAALSRPSAFAGASTLSGVMDLLTKADDQTLRARLGDPEQHAEDWKASSPLALVTDALSSAPPLMFSNQGDATPSDLQAKLTERGVKFESKTAASDLEALEAMIDWHANLLAPEPEPEPKAAPEPEAAPSSP